MEDEGRGSLVKGLGVSNKRREKKRLASLPGTPAEKSRVADAWMMVEAGVASESGRRMCA